MSQNWDEIGTWVFAYFSTNTSDPQIRIGFPDDSERY